MDTDNDGVVTFDEFKTHLEKFDLKTNAKEAFAALDMDGSGSLQYSEFIAASIHVSEDQLGEAVEDAFAKLDLDGSKSLTRAELCRMLPSNLDDVTLEKILDDADADNDDIIDLEEFKAAFKKGSELAINLNVSSAPAVQAVHARPNSGYAESSVRPTRMTSIV